MLTNVQCANSEVGSTAIDHLQHTRDFTPRLLSIVTPDYLENVCLAYQQEKGYFSTRQPAELFKRSDSAVFVWRQHVTEAHSASRDYPLDPLH